MPAWDESKFWPVAQRAGMLKLAQVALPGCPEVTDAYVNFLRPDALVGNGAALSAEYSIEYQHADLPTLAEDTEMLIDGVKYRVRSPPIVDERGTGFFRLALLTKVEC